VARKKIGRNEACPCGSGKKYKRCCLGRGGIASTYTQEDRELAVSALSGWALSNFEEEYLAAEAEAWGDYLDRQDELGDSWFELSDAVVDAWFWFDRPLPDGRLVVDAFLAADLGLSAQARTWLTRMRQTAMRAYEVTDVRPGLSVTLRDLFGGREVTVRERSASRSLQRGGFLGARINWTGASGQPEFDLSLLIIPQTARHDLLEVLEVEREDWVEEHPGEDDLAFWKSMAPFFHLTWLEHLLDLPLPTIRNRDGDDLLYSSLHFEILDQAALATALDQHESLYRLDDGWGWSGEAGGEDTALAHLSLRGEKLVVEVNSAERGERARALVEDLAGAHVLYQLTEHRDLMGEVRERILSRLHDGDAPEPREELPPELEEATLAQYSSHYRAWLDEPVPALDGRTPREAAGQDLLRERLAELLRQLEGFYQHALSEGNPAWDPSWMWDELGLAAPTPDYPPPLAHERLELAHPDLARVAGQVAAEVRRRPGFDDRSDRCHPADLELDLTARRYLEDQPAARSLLHWLSDFELHRRKTFWVDPALAWQLSQTDLDVDAQEFRLPFPALAMVFTDRHALSLAERLVATTRPDSPVCGHFARVLTVFVREAGGELELLLVADALGSDAPEVIEHRIVLAGQLEGTAAGEPVRPLPGLEHLVLNALLVATSPGVQPQQRMAPAERRTPSHGPEPVASDAVWFLPGKITLSRLRQLQDLRRAPGGGELLHRHLVRGHWRRPRKDWKDQRLRWIEPYWRGPDMAAVVEKAYRLVP